MEVMRPCIVCGKETDNPENICLACQEDVGVWTTGRYRAFCQSVKVDLQSEGNDGDDGIVMEVARNILSSDHELKEFIMREFGVDPEFIVERLANDI